MKHIWMLQESINDLHFFEYECHLEPSVRVSYCTCTDVVIERFKPSVVRDISFKVTGKRRNPDAKDIGASDVETFEHTVTFKQYPVWDLPSHL